MSTIHIIGGNKLEGKIFVQGSKNAALPILAASLLTEGIHVFENCPQITDVTEMLEILRELGAMVWTEQKKLFVKVPDKLNSQIDQKHVISMRSSVMLLGVLLSRNGAVCMEYPGGCVIGKRPIDMHIEALEQLGCKFEHGKNQLCAKVNRLLGADITLRFPSVGATENVILAAVKAKGITIIRGAAREPEIVYLCDFLKKCGAKIDGAGTDCIQIEGVLQLKACQYKMPADRIVSGTYMMCALATKGSILLENAPINELLAVQNVLKKMGAVVEVYGKKIMVSYQKPLQAVDVETNVYPGFPTDLQSPMMVLFSQAKGIGRIKETIYENRFRIVSELKKMGADMQQDSEEVWVQGPKTLYGETVVAKELRGNAALVMAGLIAKGETTVLDCQYVKRGYEDICRDLRSLGAILYEDED